MRLLIRELLAQEDEELLLLRCHDRLALVVLLDGGQQFIDQQELVAFAEVSVQDIPAQVDDLQRRDGVVDLRQAVAFHVVQVVDLGGPHDREGFHITELDEQMPVLDHAVLIIEDEGLRRVQALLVSRKDHERLLVLALHEVGAHERALDDVVVLHGQRSDACGVHVVDPDVSTGHAIVQERRIVQSRCRRPPCRMSVSRSSRLRYITPKRFPSRIS